MQRNFLLSLGLLTLFIGFGCSGSSNTNTDVVGANSANIVETPVVDSADATAALAEGKRLLDENQTEAAITSLEKAVELNPDLAEAHFQLGIAYDLLDLQKEQSGEFVAGGDEKKKPRAQKAFEKAVVAYKKWLAKNPKDDLAHFNLGRTYTKLFKDEEAVDSFEQAVKLKPDDTEYQTELGAAQINLARYHEAVKSLKKAIELDESNGRAIELLEDAEAGRSRVDYKDKNKKDANLASIAGSSRSPGSPNSANKASNTASNPDSTTKPPSGTTTPPKGAPTPKPASTPRSKEQPRGRMPNPDTRPRKIN